MSRYLPGLIFLLAALAAGIALMTGGSENPDDPMIGLDAPALRGETVKGPIPERLAAGGKPVLLNFFAGWCVPCQAEHPALLALARDPRVETVGVVWHDDPARIEKWLAQHGDPYSSILHDAKGETAILYGMTGVPESFLIAPGGKIVWHRRGPLDPTMTADGLLKEVAR